MITIVCTMHMFRQCLQTLAHPERVHTVDVFRGIAVLAVLLFHADVLPYGYLGVDLFFVVSGLLIGRMLLRQIWRDEGRLQLVPFVLSRGMKIWPSYYAMLVLGSLFAYIAYAQKHPDYIIALTHWPRYLLFFQNYRGTPHHIFDHVWSVCVEEHFYVLFPLLLMLLFRWKLCSPKFILGVISGAIVAGFLGKVAGYKIGFETFAATHNRVDGLAWGVLLAWTAERKPDLLRAKRRSLVFAAGALLAVGMLVWDIRAVASWPHAVMLHTLMPFAFAMMLGSTMTQPARMRWLWPIRFIAYYSYNLYLWHPILLPATRQWLGRGPVSTVIYLLLSLFIAIVMTWAIEEPMLRIRNAALARVGATKTSSRAASS